MTNQNSKIDNREIIDQFYSSFSNHNAEEMVNCYHDNIQFKDPAFGVLKGEDAKNMWRMLLSRNSGLKIEYESVLANENSGSANWTAKYTFSQTGRKIVNKISAKFEFKDGKIIKHNDSFDLWKWSRMAFGWKGYLLGWTPFMQNKIQESCREMLRKYRRKL